MMNPAQHSLAGNSLLVFEMHSLWHFLSFPWSFPRGTSSWSLSGPPSLSMGPSKRGPHLGVCVCVCVCARAREHWLCLLGGEYKRILKSVPLHHLLWGQRE